MFKKKNTKVPFVVVLSFSRITVAEIAKNTIKDDQILKKSLIRDKSRFDHSDFMFLNFVNDDDKVYRVIFQILMKNKEKMKQKLFAELKYMFDCSDIEIIYKQDFDFNKYNLKNGLVKGEVYNNSFTPNNQSQKNKDEVNKQQNLQKENNQQQVEQKKQIPTVASEQNKQYIDEFLEPNKMNNIQAPTINQQNIDEIGNNKPQQLEHVQKNDQQQNNFDNNNQHKMSQNPQMDAINYNKNNPFE